MAAFLRHACRVETNKLIETCRQVQKYNNFTRPNRYFHHDSVCSSLPSRMSCPVRLQRRSCVHNQQLQFCVVQLRFSSSGIATTASISESTAAATATSSITPAGPSLASYIPEPPSVPDVTEVAVQTLNALGEPSLQSLGLGSWYPSGLVQQALELIHTSLDIPWWGAIVIGTICLRVCLFPLVIKAQQNVAHMQNHLPTMTRLQEKFTQARQTGNPLEASRAAHELMSFMQRNEIRPFRQFMVPLAQIPVFLSVFFGIRQMANLPVESLKLGGMLWFTDLTVPDPYYILPLMTATSLFLTIELGVDGVKTQTMSHGMKWFMRCMPLVILPAVINFPGAMLCYWFTSNTFSLLQVIFLRIPSVRNFFNIPQLVKHDQAIMPKKKKFVEGFRESMDNSKIIRLMEERHRSDAVRFKEAGQGPVRKTYPYDPTKVKTIKALSVEPAVSAKSKSS